MVTEMTKYSFILLGEETEGFLQQMQELGFIDITRSKKPIDLKSTAYIDQADADKKAFRILQKVDYAKDADAAAIAAASKEAVIEGEPSAVVLDTNARINELGNEERSLEKIRSERLVWGRFDKEALLGLGLEVRFYAVSKKKYDPAWAENYAIQIVSEDSSYVWFVTLSEPGSEYDFPAAETSAPDNSYEETEERISAVHAELIAQKGKLLKAKELLPALQEDYDKQLTELDRYLATASKESAAENRIDVMEGFSPTASDAELQTKLEELGVLYYTEAATLDDNPPIKLKNRKFFRMFEVFTQMYGMPAYDEFDPTVILGPFYLLFWSLCMGDAGYGILLVIVGFLLKKMRSMANLSSLVVTLGVGSFVIGLFLHTFFGINLLEASWVPGWAKSCMIHGDIMGYDTAMVLAVLIGVFHICLAMVIKTAVFTKRFGFMHCISTWGWTLLIVGGVIVAALALLLNLDSAVTKIIVIVLGCVSALGIFIFNNPKRNPLINIGSGLWDTYNMATGLLGDTLSYVRLYALGLAGGMLGSAFNDLGLMVYGSHIPVVSILFCAVIMIIGHALNLAMSALGAFVHPLRLTFVEFFKNSGFTGSGKAYNPLSIKKEEI